MIPLTNQTPRIGQVCGIFFSLNLHVLLDKESVLNETLPNNSLGIALCLASKFSGENFSSIVYKENKEKTSLVTLRQEIVLDETLRFLPL